MCTRPGAVHIVIIILKNGICLQETSHSFCIIVINITINKSLRSITPVPHSSNYGKVEEMSIFDHLSYLNFLMLISTTAVDA